MDWLFAHASGFAPGASEQVEHPGAVLPPRGAGREHHHHAEQRRGRCRLSTTSAAIAARGCAWRPTGRFAGSIQCPYHAWTYGLDGRLLGAPHMEEVPHFRKEDYPLHRVARRRLGRPHLHHARQGTAAAASISSPTCPAKFSSWRMQDLRLGHRIVYDVRANWKLIIQNYNECLHCPNLHPALNKLSHYLSGENEPLHAATWAAGWTCAPDIATMSMDGSCPRAFLPELTEAGAAGVYYYAIFPNMLLSLHPDYMMVHTLWPLAPDRTINICEWHFHPTRARAPGLRRVGRDRVLGPDEPAGLARLRAVAGRDLVTRVRARAVLESGGSAVRLRSDDRQAPRSLNIVGARVLGF